MSDKELTTGCTCYHRSTGDEFEYVWEKEGTVFLKPVVYDPVEEEYITLDKISEYDKSEITTTKCLTQSELKHKELQSRIRNLQGRIEALTRHSETISKILVLADGVFDDVDLEGIKKYFTGVAAWGVSKRGQIFQPNHWSSDDNLIKIEVRAAFTVGKYPEWEDNPVAKFTSSILYGGSEFTPVASEEEAKALRVKTLLKLGTLNLGVVRSAYPNGEAIDSAVLEALRKSMLSELEATIVSNKKYKAIYEARKTFYESIDPNKKMTNEDINTALNEIGH